MRAFFIIVFVPSRSTQAGLAALTPEDDFSSEPDLNGLCQLAFM
jgi:hypothetical protein